MPVVTEEIEVDLRIMVKAVEADILRDLKKEIIEIKNDTYLNFTDDSYELSPNIYRF